jgi:hypothetical protein
MAGTHDLFVNLIGKAISTGCRSDSRTSNTKESFFNGRVTAFAYSAAMQADLLYGADFETVRHAIMREVTALRKEFTTEDRRNADLVGDLATTIAGKVLAV